MWQVCGWGRFDMCVRRGSVCVCAFGRGEGGQVFTTHTTHTHTYRCVAVAPSSGVV